MRKKIILSIITMILLLSISMCSFAMDNVTNNIRNFVGGAENMLENAGNEVTSDVKEGFNTVENGTENVVNDVRDGMEDSENTVAGVITNNDNDGGYTASRTSTDQASMMGGMMTNTWTWIIVGIVVLAIGIGIWTYVRNKNNDDSYIDSDEI